MIMNDFRRIFVDDDGVRIHEFLNVSDDKIVIDSHSASRYVGCNMQRVTLHVHGSVEFSGGSIVDVTIVLHDGGRLTISKDKQIAERFFRPHVCIESDGVAEEVVLRGVAFYALVGDFRVRANRLVLVGSRIDVSRRPLVLDVGDLYASDSQISRAVFDNLRIQSVRADGPVFYRCRLVDGTPVDADGSVVPQQDVSSCSQDEGGRDEEKEDGPQEEDMNEVKTKDLVLQSAKSGAQMVAVQRFVGAVTDEVLKLLVKAGMPKRLAHNEFVRFLAAVGVVGLVVLIAGRGLFGISRKKGEYLVAVVTASAAAIVTDKLLDMLPSLGELKSLVSSLTEDDES